jgi:hypothetical protein
MGQGMDSRSTFRKPLNIEEEKKEAKEEKEKEEEEKLSKVLLLASENSPRSTTEPWRL